jgi:hypothetical protein
MILLCSGVEPTTPSYPDPAWKDCSDFRNLGQHVLIQTSRRHLDVASC